MADISRELVSEFVSHTGSSELQAQYMLTLYDGNLNMAVDQYLEGHAPSDSEIEDIHNIMPSNPRRDMIDDVTECGDVVKRIDAIRLTETGEKLAADYVCSFPDDEKNYDSSLSSAAAVYLRHHNGNIEKASEVLLSSNASDSQTQLYLASCSGNICVAMHQLFEIHEQMDLKRNVQQDLSAAAQKYLDSFDGDLQLALNVLLDLYTDNKRSAQCDYSCSDDAAKVKRNKDAAEHYLGVAGGDFERALNMLLEVFKPLKLSEYGKGERQLVVDEYLAASDLDVDAAINAIVDSIQDNGKCKSKDHCYLVRDLLDHFHGDYNAALRALGKCSRSKNEERPPLAERRQVTSGNHSADYCPCGNKDPVNLKHYYFNDTDKDEVEFIGFFCKACEQEFVVAGVMSGGEQLAECMQKDLVCFDRKLYRNPKKVLQDIVSISTKVKAKSIHDLQVGDEFVVNRLNIYTHHGIVFSTDAEKKKFEGIHYNKLGGMTKSDARIIKEAFHMAEVDVSVRRYDKKAEDHPKLVVARASSSIGDRAYNLFVNNCEHFATFCKTGISGSSQVKDALNWVKGKIDDMVTETNLRTGKNFLAKYAFPAGKGNVLKKSKVVESGIMIAVEGKSMIFEISQLNEERGRGAITRVEYLEKICTQVLQSVIDVSIRVGCAVSSGLGGWFGRLLFPISKGIGVFFGSILGGKVGSLSDNKLGNIIGSGISSLVIPHAITCNDRAVQKLSDLNVGDHIVISPTVLHPRCHGIVTGRNNLGCFKMLRSTYELGVIEEFVEFKLPVYRVVYGDGESRDVDETLRRGRSKLGTNEYNLLTNNCKHFALWCKKK